jgi:multidrug efflux pump subunit AcrB
VTDGSSSTVVQFTVGSVDIDRALNDVKDQIAKVREDLPRAIDEPVVSRVDVEGLPIVAYAASAPGLSVKQLPWFVDDAVARALKSIPGVGEVNRFGGVDREIRVSLDPEKLLALGVTAAAVNEQVRADNVDVAGGRGEIAGQEQAIRTLAGARSIADLAALPIALPGGRKVRLDELGTVVDGAAEPHTFTRLFDQPILAFGITRAKGASDVTVDERIAKRLAEIASKHPEVSFTKVDTQVDSELGNYHSTLETLVEGALLAVVVVLLFLRDLRATIVTAVALPLSVIPTFWAMDAIGFSLNLVTLLAITLVTGILIDDAIVEIENIARHMRMGKSAWRASLEAADEIGLAVIAISLSIVAIFSPVSFMEGIAGQYFRQFGLTVAIAVLFSLMVARFVTPVIAAYFLRAPREAEQVDGRTMQGYTRLVGPPCAIAGSRFSLAHSSSPARCGRPGFFRRASFRPRTPVARCSRSSCRPARGSTTRTGSRARSPRNSARCRKSAPRSFSAGRFWAFWALARSRARRPSSSTSCTSPSAKRRRRICRPASRGCLRTNRTSGSGSSRTTGNVTFRCTSPVRT